MKASILIGLGVLLCLNVAGQKARVEGRVIAGDSALAGVTVAAASAQTVTDTAGRFVLELQEGKQALLFTAVGFAPLRRVVNIADSNAVYLFEMQPAENAMEELVVTGTLRPVHRLASPMAVEVYSAQFFKKNPAPSLFESLQNMNGVRPQINCSVCNTGDIHINGLEGPYTMVTIDGMPIVSALSSVYGLFGIPSQLIERVEVVKGPASGLYGSEAIGGLINIITRQPSRAPRFAANLMTTSWLEHSADLGFRFNAGKKLTSLLGVNLFQYGQLHDRNGDRFTDVTQQRRISIFSKWSLERPQGRQATLAARYFYEDRWGGDLRWNKAHRGSNRIYGESIYTRRWELIGNYQLPVPGRLYLSTSATLHDQDAFYGIMPYVARQQILFGQLRWEKSLSGGHELLAGLALRHNYYDDNTTATKDTLSGKNRADRAALPGLFLQDEWKLNDRHSLLMGIRLDHHPAHKLIFTPRLAYRWQVAEGQVLRLNAGTGFRVVNLFTEDHAALTGAREVIVEEELKPERSYNANLNYSYSFGGASARFTLDASAWYTYFHNQIIADYERDPNAIYYGNLRGHALSRGFTFNLEMNIQQRLKAIAGLTIQDVAKREPDTDGRIQTVRPNFTERWSGTWAISYSFPEAGITLDYTGNVYGPMRLPLLSALDPRRQYSPVWSIQNLQVTKWLSKEVEIYGGVKNLFNWTPARGNPFLIARADDPFDDRVEYDAAGQVMATPENPYALTFDPTYIYAPNQGRRAFVGLRFTFR
jgi:outer membrane receptor for ferrienterochelin and colicins